MPVSVEVVIPVLNEERQLPESVRKLNDFLGHYPERDWRIVIADNGSTDRTPSVAQELSRELPAVRLLRLEQRGRGRALKQAWLGSKADVRCYMDVDLSTELRFLPDMVTAIADQGFDIAIGSRLARGSVVVGRPLKREITSRGYSALFRTMFFTKFKDAQCGFKAVSAEAAAAILPLVKDNGWFFDTEMLIIGQHSGFRIREIPVKWIDDPDSRVKILKTAIEDVKGLLRLRFGGTPRADRRGRPG
ncbi:MAG: glycosyltransferase family 2 protein [SAR202 cluster bacterium]|nr:glycosyltransferase family 2 protein [SAR202 cluster bacterium]